MKPGRELDAMVAEKVMGLRPKQCKLHPGNTRCGVQSFEIEGKTIFQEWGCLYCLRYSKKRIDPARELKPYSTDIAAAWEVVEKLQERGTLTVSSARGGSVGELKTFAWCVEIHGPEVEEWGDTAPHAICLAALKAVGALE